MTRSETWNERALVLALALSAHVLSACGQSRVDAIVAESAGDSDAGVTSGTSCGVGVEAPGAGFFRFRAMSSGYCLGAGGPSNVLGASSFDVELLEDCSAAGQLWHLIDLSQTDGYWIRNVSTENNLDIETGDDSDGTAAVLFEPALRENQRFLFRSRAPSRYEFSPLHVQTSCVTNMGDGAEIWPCSDANPDQEWELIVDLCE